MRNLLLITVLLLSACTTQKLYRINSVINKIPYVADTKADLKNPEYFKKHGGNCKDYVEAKYAEVKKLGVPDSRIKFIIGDFDIKNKESHAMLEVDGYVMDNNRLDIVPAHEVKGVRFTREQWLKIWEQLRKINNQ